MMKRAAEGQDESMWVYKSIWSVHSGNKYKIALEFYSQSFVYIYFNHVKLKKDCDCWNVYKP